MKKIMFDDEHSLTVLVLAGKKMQTRRLPSVKFKVGEVVAVAQSYRTILNDVSGVNTAIDYILAVEKLSRKSLLNCQGTTNKMYVRADLMPWRIRITDVRTQRLQDITEEECMAEGISKSGDKGYWRRGLPCAFYSTAREAYAALIDKMIGKGVWDSNPEVMAYTFELLDKVSEEELIKASGV